MAKKPKSKVSKSKNNPAVVMITIVLTIFAIIFLSLICYKFLNKHQRIVTDKGEYIIIQEDGRTTVTPGKMILPTTPPYIVPPTTGPQIK